MHVVSLGAGAIGGYFAGRLAASGAADVSFLVRPGRKAQLERDGLKVESPLGNFALPVTARLGSEIGKPADYVLVTCKAYDLEGAIASIAPAVGPDTAIVPMLNGLSHLDRLNDAFGRQRVLGGLAQIGITMLPDGTIKHLNDWARITFGEQNGALSQRVTDLRAAFDQTKGVEANAVPDILQKMWEKLVFLSTLASVTCLMRANIGEISRAAGGSEIMLDLLRRNAQIAGAEGYAVPPDVLDRSQKMLSDPGSQNAASMLRDIERHGPIEGEHIVGFMLKKARQHGLDDTLHRICYAHAEAYEQRRAAERL